MREAVWGEQALGCPDRGLFGGFSASLLRLAGEDAKAFGHSRSWAQAALTSYALKTPTDRSDVCARLAGLLPAAQAGRRGIDASSPVDVLPGVGPRSLIRLEAMGIGTIADLLEHLPRTWLDRRETRRIADLRVGQECTFIATVRESKPERVRSGRRLLRCVVSDGSGYVECIWWGQDWRARTLVAGVQAAFSGKVEARMGRLQMSNPSYDLIDDASEAINTGRVVPVYPASEQVPAAFLRRLLHSAFDRLESIHDPLPARVRAERNLLGREAAFRLLHFPEDPAQIPDARRRLVFDELFTLEVGLALRKTHLEREVRGISQPPDGELPHALISSLPFAPTGAQSRAMDEIGRDMAAPRPMHRLLQGEVGSGKTIIAVWAAVAAAESGNQAAIMAPTEVLAEQHARRIRELLDPLGIDVALLTSSVPAAQRRDTVMRLAAGDIKVACGTHALLSSDVAFRRLGLAVIDEQHRFGVRQRIDLKAKGPDPDVLIMTATPIPRTLALTLYGDLDVSILDELPAGRRPVRTEIIGMDTPDRERAYDLIRREVAAGARAYVICALIDESDTLQAKAAVAEAERLRADVFPDLGVGLMHGAMRPAEKERVMDAFRTGEAPVLISTTVVEVGVDVPEATVMLIENAERFGLSQLHQLRGRIGRGERESHCILFAGQLTEDARERLDAIASTTDGFALAEVDLRIRGEGTIFGTRQAGMPDLRIARLVEDFPIVVEAREAAFALVAADPHLRSPENAGLRGEVTRRFEDVLDWLRHG
jgi:ATP-dependent DNA helicase RecG